MCLSSATRTFGTMSDLAFSKLFKVPQYDAFIALSLDGVVVGYNMSQTAVPGFFSDDLEVVGRGVRG